MKQTDSAQKLIGINQLDTMLLVDDYQIPLYQILLIDRDTVAQVDFTAYSIPAHSILFLSPYQHLQIHHAPHLSYRQLTFHGDYYCIEYHKKEVACNGILFNNIYIQPYVTVGTSLFNEIEQIYQKIADEISLSPSNSDSIIKAYLQLLLALCSKEKKLIMEGFSPLDHTNNTTGNIFQKRLEEFFRTQKSVQYYADQANINLDSFSKKIRQQLGKSPSLLIQERTVLEAKKLLHLTHLPIKEIAETLNFNDEYYFSRYFKKNVGISPSQYREKVGISIVAK